MKKLFFILVAGFLLFFFVPNLGALAQPPSASKVIRLQEAINKANDLKNRLCKKGRGNLHLSFRFLGDFNEWYLCYFTF